MEIPSSITDIDCQVAYKYQIKMLWFSHLVVITRRFLFKEAIFASLRISKDSDSPLAEKIRHMGQKHSKRVAKYIAEVAPDAETVLAYSCEAK